MSSPFDTLPAPGRHRDITPADVVLRPEGIRLIDVREPHEFVGELGHIAGAHLVPLGTVAGYIGEWKKDEEIIFVCRSGGRSGRAASAFAEAGFTRTSNMLGGMLRWNDEARPVER
jgi:rhodanese-related sulfurtransferase